MAKRIAIATVLSFVIGAITWVLNNLLISAPLRFSLVAVYTFHAVSACLVYIAIITLHKFMPNQAGYGYLTSVFIKMGCFVLLFKNSVFALEVLSKTEKASLIAPLFIFLILEAVLVSKLLMEDSK